MRLFFFLIGFLSFSLFSQSPVLLKLSDKIKLPDNEIYGIHESHDGILFLAGDRGLFKYDGQEFTNILHPKQKGQSVFYLTPHENTLYYTNLYGQIFQLQDDSVSEVADLNPLSKGALNKLHILNKNILCISNYGLVLINEDHESSLISNTSFLNSIIYKNHVVAISNNGNITWINYDGDIVNELNIPSNTNNFFRPFLFSSDNELFLYFQDKGISQLYLIEKDQVKKLKGLSKLDHKIVNRVNCIDDKIWFCSDNGVYTYTIKNNTPWPNQEYLISKSCSDVIKDQNNNFIFSTLHEGLFIIQNQALKQIGNSLNQDYFTYIHKIDNNQILLGTKNGELILYNTNDFRHTKIQLPNKKLVCKILNYNDGSCLVSTNSNEAYVYDYQKNNISSITNKIATAKGLENLGDAIYYGNFKEALVFTNYNELSDPIQLYPKRNYGSYYNPKTQTLYIAFVDGIKAFNKEYDEISLPEELSNILVTDFTSLSDESLVISTQNSGIYVLQNNKIVKQYCLGNILSSNYVSKVCALGNDIWFVNENGLNLINESGTLTRFNEQDGINENVVDLISINGKLFLISPNTLYELNTSQLQPKNQLPPPYLKELKVNDVQQIYNADKKYSSNENRFQLSLGTNALLSAEFYDFKYKLSGIHENFQTSANNTINFQNLAPGSYELEIKTDNKKGLTSKESLHLQFHILPPFYKRTWFVFSIMIVILFVFYLILNIYAKNKQKEKEEIINKTLRDKQLIELKMENLRSQMNPHFIFNALNTIQDFIIDNQKNLASDFLVKFSKLMRMYLNHSQHNFISLSQEIEAIKLYLSLEKVRFNNELDYQINIDQNLNTNQVNIPSLLLQPFVENALLHGLRHKKNNRQLIINIEKKEKQELHISILDNGIGRHASEKINENTTHKSFATNASIERINLFQKQLNTQLSLEIIDLYDKQTPDGTLVKIVLPLTLTK